MQTQTQTTKAPASLTYHRGCRIKEVPFSNPKQYEALGRVHDSYGAACEAINGSFTKLAESIQRGK